MSYLVESQTANPLAADCETVAIRQAFGADDAHRKALAEHDAGYWVSVYDEDGECLASISPRSKFPVFMF